MKSILYHILLLFIFSSTTSCVVSENVKFNEDFSGTYSAKFGMDFWFLLKYFSDEDSRNSNLLEESSIVYFDDIFNDDSNSSNIDNTDVELSKEMKILKTTNEVFKPRVETAITFEFDNLETLSNSLNEFFISNIVTEEDRNLHAYQKNTIELAKQKNLFYRKSSVVEEPKKESIQVESSNQEDQEGFKSSKYAMNYIKFRSSYRFPKNIANVKSGNVYVGDDKKTILIKPFSAGKIAKNPSLTDFELIFEQ